MSELELLPSRHPTSHCCAMIAGPGLTERLRDVCFVPGRCSACSELGGACLCAVKHLTSEELHGMSDCPLLRAYHMRSTDEPITFCPAPVQDPMAALAMAETIARAQFVDRVKARVEMAQASSRNCSNVSWLYHNWTGNRAFNKLQSFITHLCHSHGAVYVGVTKDPVWRMHGIKDSQARLGEGVRVDTFKPHDTVYDKMLILDAGSARDVAQLERKLISALRSALRNRIAGGGRVKCTADAIWFLYAVIA